MDLNEMNSRTTGLFEEQRRSIAEHTDQLFARLMFLQWLVAMGLAILISPHTWTGARSELHLHVWAGIFLGGIIGAFPIWMALKHPGKTMTRHTVAVGQMLMSALLIHLTGGRIETHFHVFGSLAILAFYRDWRVLISASLVVVADHLARGFWWPQSVYGVLTATLWRSLEHAGWVIFEVTFLLVAVRKSLSEMMHVAERQTKLEALNENIERTVAERTAELTRENLERKQVEAQLAKAQRIAHLGSWEWNIVENKVTWSDETRRLYGFEPADLGAPMDRCIAQRVHPDDAEQVQSALAEALRTRQPYHCDHRAILPDGTERFIHGIGEVILDAAGLPIRMIGTAQDISEAKRAAEALRQSEERLRQSQKMEAVGQLAGGIAHDFNNLLTVINGYSALSIQQISRTNPLYKNIEEIQNAAERAASLTGQLLAFSRKQVLQPRVLQLNTVLGGMEKMVRRLIGEHIELTTVCDEELGNVKADQGQIEQVILNLAVNARDAMPRGGKLNLRTSNVSIDQKTHFRNRTLEVGDYIMLAISDTGVGMTDEVKAHLFEPFFTTKGLGRGTGLGLATCYGIVCQSDGDIRVYSEPDSGTTFKIYLPRVDAAVPQAVPDLGADVLPAGHESVLVVEDESAVRKLAVSILSGRGYQVQEARDAVEAMKLIETHPHFDLIVTDVIMPRMSGKELHEKIKIFLPDVKVMFMSGYTDDALAQHGVLQPGLSFLEKPFSPARLARKVREVIDEKPARAPRVRISSGELSPLHAN